MVVNHFFSSVLLLLSSSSLFMCLFLIVNVNFTVSVVRASELARASAGGVTVKSPISNRIINEVISVPRKGTVGAQPGNKKRREQ